MVKDFNKKEYITPMMHVIKMDVKKPVLQACSVDCEVVDEEEFDMGSIGTFGNDKA